MTKDSDLFKSSEKKSAFSFLSPSPPQLETQIIPAKTQSSDAWKILVVDDEEDIHTVTKMALKGFMFEDRKIQFLHAYSSKEAIEMIGKHPNIALALVDVVMETQQAGLDFVEYIRKDIKNHFTRIILRTGQPGEAPELQVIQKYEIDDYKLKTDLTRDKLFSVILASIRTYEAMMEVESYRLHLDDKVKARTLEIEEKNALLSTQKSELESLNQLKNKLFSIIAHDLRSPFANLKLLLDMIDDEYLSLEDLKEMLPNFKDNLDSTFELLENLLSWAGSQLQGSQLKQAITDLETLIDDNIILLKGVAEKKKITLKKEIQNPVTLNVDPNLIKLVIRNLLSNALKFTPIDGQVTIKMGKENKHAFIAIHDTGAGISAEHQKKLFQLKGFSTRGTQGEKGTGLGLALCREFVEKHEGTIALESEVGKGSTFTIFLPIPN